jgi:hypothetical protein
MNRNPGVNDTGVGVRTDVAATFSEAVRGVDTATFTLRKASRGIHDSAGNPLATTSWNVTTR